MLLMTIGDTWNRFNQYRFELVQVTIENIYWNKQKKTIIYRETNKRHLFVMVFPHFESTILIFDPNEPTGW